MEPIQEPQTNGQLSKKVAIVIFVGTIAIWALVCDSYGSTATDLEATYLPSFETLVNSES